MPDVIPVCPQLKPIIFRSAHQAHSLTAILNGSRTRDRSTANLLNWGRFPGNGQLGQFKLPFSHLPASSGSMPAAAAVSMHLKLGFLSMGLLLYVIDFLRNNFLNTMQKYQIPKSKEILQLFSSSHQANIDRPQPYSYFPDSNQIGIGFSYKVKTIFFRLFLAMEL
jgi:hypothetical protein